MTDLVIGLDVGTGGARALAVDRQGQVIARADAKFEHPPYEPEPGRFEQDADEWWRASQRCLRQLMAEIDGHTIHGISVDSTSGTFVPVDADGQALMPALMYNDGRARELEDRVNAAAGDLIDRLGYHFPPAFALVKLAWLKENQPDIVERTHCFLHAADFIVGRLTGDYSVSDTSNALKTGVNLIDGTWPDFIETELGLPLDRFPRVVFPGEKVGELSQQAADDTGLPAGLPVIAGASDGTASFLSTGAGKPGDWALTIGTTIVTRGVSKDLVRDPLGRMYCHRHPEGYWLPGGASNVGGEGLIKTFGADQIDALDQQARQHIPTSLVVYPLVRRGERMPFVSSAAEGFVLGDPANEAERFAGYLEGIAMMTAWSVWEASALGAADDGDYYLCGGAAKGQVLPMLLASIFNKPIHIVSEPDAAMGSALLAAGWAWHEGSISAAQSHMVHSVATSQPDPTLTTPLRDKLEELKAECQRRGYL